MIDDVIVTESKMNKKKYLVLNAGNSFLNPLKFKIVLWRGGGGGVASSCLERQVLQYL